MPKELELIYFNGRGRAELIRLVLLAGNIKFKDERIELEDWPALKPSTPAGQMPFVTLPCGTVLNQSFAIARYFAKQADLLGSTDMDNYRIDRAIYTLEDLFKKYATIFHENDEEKKETLKANLKKSGLPDVLNILTKYLKETEGPFFIGNKSTIADLHLLDVLDHADESELKGFPEIVKCREKVLEKYPALKQYREKRIKTSI